MGTKKIAYINPKILTWARNDSPLLFEEISLKSGCSIEDIKSWESGESYPSITEAKKLAKIYDIPFASLFLTNPPSKKKQLYADRRTVYKSDYDGISYELWLEIRRIITNREIAVESLPDIISYYKPLPAIEETDSIEEVARSIRTYFNFSVPFKNKSAYKSNSFNYFRNLFENNGIMVAQITDVPVSEIKGLSIYFDEIPIIAANNKDWDRSKTFTLFHEMAHLLRRSSSICLVDFDERNDEEEKICDKIAAETLLPKNSFLELVNYENDGNWNRRRLESIADKFGVSSVVVLRRLFELEKIDLFSYRKLYKELEIEFISFMNKSDSDKKKNTGFPSFKTIYLSQQGALFPRLLLIAYSNGNLSYGEMCRSLNIKTDQIGKIEQAVMFK
ncbi:MAG: ImmA/IrrE family metallo-endopeptidase [Methanosarcinales archaeon]|jgi:Zn-dependent peptidase ImmA (M78 family)/DNA-binding XRE family transcriptional regulator|nr:ImmA/IrrE family metallo-endopeptidase [Methanosarcinales archaeon]